MLKEISPLQKMIIDHYNENGSISFKFTSVENIFRTFNTKRVLVHIHDIPEIIDTIYNPKYKIDLSNVEFINDTDTTIYSNIGIANAICHELAIRHLPYDEASFKIVYNESDTETLNIAKEIMYGYQNKYQQLRKITGALEKNKYKQDTLSVIFLYFWILFLSNTITAFIATIYDVPAISVLMIISLFILGYRLYSVLKNIDERIKYNYKYALLPYADQLNTESQIFTLRESFVNSHRVNLVSVFIWFINNFLLLNNNHNIIIESSFLSKSMTIKTIINS